MRSMRAKLIVAGALLVVSGAVVWALLTSDLPVSLTVRGLTIRLLPEDVAKQRGHSDYVFATLELSNASNRAITYWGYYSSNFADCSILSETPTGWKPLRQGFRCGTGLERFTLAAHSSVSFDAVVERDKPCKVAIRFSDGRAPSRLWQRLPRWLAQRLPWCSGDHTAVSAVIDVRNPGRLPVDAPEPLVKPPESTANVRRTAENGDADAQFKLAGRYWIGDGVEQSAKEALKWYENAANGGHVEAAYNLGTIYEYGVGITANKIDALKWYRKAGERGHAAAREKLQALASN